MFLSIVFGVVVTILLCVNAFAEGPPGSPDATRYDALIVGAFTFMVTFLLGIELKRNNLNSLTNRDKKTRFITRMSHGLLMLVAFSTFLFDSLGAILLPPLLFVSWLISEVVLIIIRRFNLAVNISKSYQTASSTYHGSKGLKKLTKVAIIIFVLYFCFTLFEQMISNAFLK